MKRKPLEIAATFCERFQKHYPKEPLHEMMEDLRVAIQQYGDTCAARSPQAERGKIQRWKMASGNMVTEPDGDYVTYRDYLANTAIRLRWEHCESPELIAGRKEGDDERHRKLRRESPGLATIRPN